MKREELVAKIEKAREQLNKSIDLKLRYEDVYENSVQLDKLIELYIVSEF